MVSRILVTLGFKPLVSIKDVLKALETKPAKVATNVTTWKQKLENEFLQVKRSLKRIEMRELRIESREQKLEETLRSRTKHREDVDTTFKQASSAR